MLQPMPTLPPGIFTNYSPAPANGAVTLLLLDALNTPWADQAFVRWQLLKFLEQVPPGTRIAIFGLTNRYDPPILYCRSGSAQGRPG